jgi:hypothetical protein
MSSLSSYSSCRPALNARSAAAVRAVKRAVVGRCDLDNDYDDNHDDDHDVENVAVARRRRGSSDFGVRGDEEREAFASVWGATDNLRAVQEALGKGKKT